MRVPRAVTQWSLRVGGRNPPTLLLSLLPRFERARPPDLDLRSCGAPPPRTSRRTHGADRGRDPRVVRRFRPPAEEPTTSGPQSVRGRPWRSLRVERTTSQRRWARPPPCPASRGPDRHPNRNRVIREG